MIKNALIVVNISFNGETKALTDKGYPMKARFTSRLLASYFCKEGESPRSTINKLLQIPGFNFLSIPDVISIIVEDHCSMHSIFPQ